MLPLLSRESSRSAFAGQRYAGRCGRARGRCVGAAVQGGWPQGHAPRVRGGAAAGRPRRGVVRSVAGGGGNAAELVGRCIRIAEERACTAEGLTV